MKATLIPWAKVSHIVKKIPGAVFEQLKSNNNFKRFTRKGMDKVKLDFSPMEIRHNLRKMIAKTPTKKIKMAYLESLKQCWKI